MKSIKIVHKWWATWGTLPVRSWVKAASLYKDGKYSEAVEHYKKGLETHGRHPARFCARMDLAYCLFRTHKFEEAEAHLRCVVENIPQSREANLRLAQLYTWSGNHARAALTLREAVNHAPTDEDLIARFLLAALENGGPAKLLHEAVAALFNLDVKQLGHGRLEVARAALAVHRGETDKGLAMLLAIASRPAAPFEAHVLCGRLMLQEGKVAEARTHLTHALSMSPHHPIVLSLLAQSYLVPGTTYAPDFACQVGTQACQNSGWANPFDMHVLAQAFYHAGDKMSALLIASKAKEVGSRLGVFRDAETIDQLIATLSAGTLA